MAFRTDNGPKPKLLFVRKIWDKAPHNAFTDLVLYQGYWYCVFREAQSHQGDKDFGSIRVIRSADTEEWTSVYYISDKTVDLRDPKITIAPHKRLMLSYTKAKILSNSAAGLEQQFQTMVCFSKNGTRWKRPVKTDIINQVAWRIVWHKDTAYTVGWHKNTGVNLYRSSDGIHYTHLCKFNLGGFPNETSLLFTKEDEMKAIVRIEDKPTITYVGESMPPYNKWAFTRTADIACGPNAVFHPDGTALLSYRAYRNVGGVFFLGELRNNIIYETLMMPSGGDCGYAGMIWKDNALWVSYYSSHEGKTAIYLAKVGYE